MPILIPSPSSTIHESCQTYLMLHYIHITHHTIILNQNKSFGNKQPSNHITVSPSASLRLRGLAQANHLRLGEGSKGHPETNAGSRLGETPLAWARCLLAQKFDGVAWATLRANWFGRIPVCLA